MLPGVTGQRQKAFLFEFSLSHCPDQARNDGTKTNTSQSSAGSLHPCCFCFTVFPSFCHHLPHSYLGREGRRAGKTPVSHLDTACFPTAVMPRPDLRSVQETCSSALPVCCEKAGGAAGPTSTLPPGRQSSPGLVSWWFSLPAVTLHLLLLGRWEGCSSFSGFQDKNGFGSKTCS